MKKQKIVLTYRGTDPHGKRIYLIEKVFNLSDYNPGQTLTESEMKNLVGSQKIDVEIKGA